MVRERILYQLHCRMARAHAQIHDNLKTRGFSYAKQKLDRIDMILLYMLSRAPFDPFRLFA